MTLAYAQDLDDTFNFLAANQQQALQGLHAMLYAIRFNRTNPGVTPVMTAGVIEIQNRFAGKLVADGFFSLTSTGIYKLTGNGEIFYQEAIAPHPGRPYQYWLHWLSLQNKYKNPS